MNDKPLHEWTWRELFDGLKDILTQLEIFVELKEKNESRSEEFLQRTKMQINTLDRRQSIISAEIDRRKQKMGLQP